MVKCLPNCVKCCLNTEMILSERDISRICRLGYSREQFTELRSGFWRLKNINHHCFFLNPKERRCVIYRYRPEGCRIYPVIYDLNGGFMVDKECPAWRTVGKAEFKAKSKRLKILLKRMGVRVSDW